MKNSEIISKIIDNYSAEKSIRISSAYTDGGLEPLFPRLERAALDQVESDDETFSRYAIWANTVRDTIIQAVKMINENSNNKEVLPLLIRAANSLSAFSEIQALLDPDNTGL
jgi:hypothetical protein